MRTPLIALVGVIAAGTQLACKGSEGPSEHQLTQAEAAMLLPAINTAMATALGSITVGAPPKGVQAVPTTFSGNLTAPPTPCQTSGTTSATGTFSGAYEYVNSVFNYEYDFDMSLHFNSCALPADQFIITLTDNPGLTFDGHYELAGQAYSYDWNETGGVAYTTSDGRSGSCDIDYQYNLSVDATGNHFGYTATVCGFSFSFTQ